MAQMDRKTDSDRNPVQVLEVLGHVPLLPADTWTSRVELLRLKKSELVKVLEHLNADFYNKNANRIELVWLIWQYLATQGGRERWRPLGALGREKTKWVIKNVQKTRKLDWRVPLRASKARSQGLSQEVGLSQTELGSQIYQPTTSQPTTSAEGEVEEHADTVETLPEVTLSQVMTSPLPLEPPALPAPPAPPALHEMPNSLEQPLDLPDLPDLGDLGDQNEVEGQDAGEGAFSTYGITQSMLEESVSQTTVDVMYGVTQSVIEPTEPSKPPSSPPLLELPPPPASLDWLI